MTEYAYRVYENIIQATTSDLIYFFILLSILIAVALVPSYSMLLKYRKDMRKGDAESEGMKHDKQMERETKLIERERQILEVIKENTAVIAGLKVTLESFGDATRSALERIHTRIDGANAAINEIGTDVAKIKAKLENSLSNQTEMASKINKILLIVNANQPKDG